MAFSVQQPFPTFSPLEVISSQCRWLAGSFCLLAVLAGAVQAAPEVNFQIEQHFLAAQKAQQQGDLATSVREYQAILRLKPDFAEVHMNLGLVYHAQKKFEDSARELEEGLSLKADLLGANLFLGINYCKLNQSARAIPYLQKVVARDPGNKEGLFWLGSALLDSGGKLQAIQLLEKSVETRSSDLDLLHLLGVACQQAGRDAFDKVKALGAGSTHTSQILAESYAAQGEWDKAVFHYRQLLQKSPGWVGAHLGLGVILLQQGKLTEAREHFLQELANDPFSAAAHARLGEVAVLQGDRPEALKSFRQALQIRAEQALSALGLGYQPFWQQPQEGTAEGFRAPLEAALEEWSRLPDAERAGPAVHLGLALVNARLGREAEAQKALNALQAPLTNLKTPVRESREGSQPAGENQARALFREKRFEEAVALLEKALRAKPRDAEARYALARSSFELHDYRKASAELGRILQRDSRHLAATALLGKCYQSLSLLAFGRIVALEPDSYRAHQLLGQAYEARNQDDKAIAEYQVALAKRLELPGLHLAIGRLHLKNLRLDDAVAELRKELEINPVDPDANLELGSVYVNQHHSQAGIRHLQLALRMRPGLVEAHRHLGKAFYMEEQFAKAEAELKLAVAADEDGSIYYLLGNVYRKLGRQREGNEAFETMNRIKQAKLKETQQRAERSMQKEAR